MARYLDVHPRDPQPRVIAQAVAMLRDDALIAYPTDSCYALGFELDSRTGADRIRRIRHLDERHHFTLVCSDFAQLGEFVQLNNAVFRSIKTATRGRTRSSSPPRARCPNALLIHANERSAYESPTTPSSEPCCANWANRWCRAPCCCPARTSR